jgi:putative tricarboxylic transport membrane protein
LQRASKQLSFRIRGPRDFWGGVALMVIALVAIWASGDLSGMHGFAFGPGTAPRMFSILLLVCGAGIALSGLLVDGPDIETYAFLGPALICVAILAFAMMIRPLGLIGASYAAFFISIIASKEMRWIESIIAGVVMTAFCVGLFVYVLKLPFQLMPWFWY